MPKPSKKSVDAWKEFAEWLCQQQIVATVDFKQSIQCKCEMSVIKRHLKKTENNIIECYEAADDRCRHKHHITIDEEMNEECTKVTAEMKFNGSMITHSNIVGVACDVIFNCG